MPVALCFWKHPVHHKPAVGHVGKALVTLSFFLAIKSSLASLTTLATPSITV